MPRNPFLKLKIQYLHSIKKWSIELTPFLFCQFHTSINNENSEFNFSKFPLASLSNTSAHYFNTKSEQFLSLNLSESSLSLTNRCAKLLITMFMIEWANFEELSCGNFVYFDKQSSSFLNETSEIFLFMDFWIKWVTGSGCPSYFSFCV